MNPGNQAYTSIPEGGWTFQVSVHRGPGLASVPSAPGAFRLVWVTEGSALLDVGGQQLSVHGPGLVWIGSRDRVTAHRDHTEVRAVVFHPGALNDAFTRGDVYDLSAFQGTTRSDQYYLHPFLLPPEGRLNGVTLSLVLVERLQGLFDRMEDELQNRGDGFWPCRTRSLLLETLMLARQIPPSDPSPPLVDQVLAYLQTHYAEPLSLPLLARRFATNRTTLATRFREQTGQSLGQYLRSLRVKVAEVILRDTTLPIHEVLERVGFADPSQFGRLFRRETGHSPSEYRRRHNWILRPAS